MSQKAFEDGSAKTTASISRTGRISAVLGILSAMVRGGRGRGARRNSPMAGIAVPRGVRVVNVQAVSTAGSDFRLLR